MSIFGRLGFDATAAGSSVQPLSDAAQKQVKSLPPLLNDWQTADMASSSVGGYYQNPLVANLTSVWATCNSIIAITDAAQTNANAILVAANTVARVSAPNFKRHTDRISGVEAVDSSTTALPHLDTAMGIGKMVMYIVGQTDGIMNNAPLMGAFTSLQTNDNLVSFYNTIQSFPSTIRTSLNYSTYTDPITGNTTTTVTSNLSSAQISTMTSQLSSISTLMDTRRNGDVSFYTNSKAVVDDYNTVTQFSNMGQSQTQLVQSVGTPKLLARLNS
jgi:hypothetical protein